MLFKNFPGQQLIILGHKIGQDYYTKLLNFLIELFLFTKKKKLTKLRHAN